MAGSFRGWCWKLDYPTGSPRQTVAVQVGFGVPAQIYRAPLRLGHRLYFEQVVPRLTALLGGDSTAYTYLPQSARAFPEPPALARIIEAAGWSEVRYKLLGMGAVAVHTAIKL